MARQGTAQNNAASQADAAAQAAALQRANTATDQFNKDLAGLKAEGNPYINNPTLTANENLMAATGAHAATMNNKNQVDQIAERSGENTAARPYLTAQMNHDQAQAQATALENQQAQDYDKGQQWKQWLQGQTLAPAGIQSQIYGTATQGASTANTNLANIGNSTWNNITGLATSMMKGAAAGAAG